jgi:hypothetical protein
MSFSWLIIILLNFKEKYKEKIEKLKTDYDVNISFLTDKLLIEFEIGGKHDYEIFILDIIDVFSDDSDDSNDSNDSNDFVNGKVVVQESDLTNKMDIGYIVNSKLYIKEIYGEKILLNMIVPDIDIEKIVNERNLVRRL